MAVIDAVQRHGIETLEALNEKSVKHAYTIDDLDWARPVDPTKLWSPEAMAPLFHLPSFQALPADVRLRYNQLFAVGVCEQFVWFEQVLLCRVFRSLLPKSPDMPALLREALENFIIEEDKHSEMFWRMCEKALPELYPTRQFALFNTSKLTDLALGLMIKQPRVFLMWCWTTIFFEERTVDYCRQYRKAIKEGVDLDANFVEVHEYHFKDEARHFQLDHHILTWLYDPQPAWRKRMAAKHFVKLMRAFVSPQRTSRVVLDRLRREFPAAATTLDALERELPQLRTSRSFHEAVFSRKSVGRAMALFSEYPELDAIWEHFVVEDKRAAPATS